MRFLSSDPSNKVFALVRDKAAATELRDFVESDANNHKNVIVLEADLDDYKTIKVCLCTFISASSVSDRQH